MKTCQLKIVTIIGARPQFIKAAIVSRLIAQCDDMEEIIVHTGQHFDFNMSDSFFKELSLPHPRYQLNINCLNHGAMTGRMMEKLEELLLQEQPDWVLVYGDTDSTLAGALAAKKLHIRVAHVEAGLRSFNMDMPEEINRILTDRISDVLFCPTPEAVQNINKEGFANFNATIVQSGDVMQDAALFYAQRAKKPVASLPKDFILCTVHRAENIENPIRLNAIFDTLNSIAQELPIVLPLHPHTRRQLSAMYSHKQHPYISFIDPVGYLEMIWLLQHCQFVMTDSGGLQKEAYFFRKFCLTLREETEWTELVENGISFLVGANPDKIKEGVAEIIRKKWKLFQHDLYGNAHAAERILTELRNVLGK
ncbi:MAG: UDP-N-acetylglucosamine 2-epimerase (non-hydrolyzing) [Bacteroidales bacterium]|jgi:UDP-GlcNAc3NAcA epimerase|nr:UDP-N-acetylglucosamine 2-epimerase (non-hydrolyzing) [Bacteroidales bacterium]